MVAYLKGSVFSGADYALSFNKDKVFLQFFKNETVTNSVGVAF